MLRIAYETYEVFVEYIFMTDKEIQIDEGNNGSYKPPIYQNTAFTRLPEKVRNTEYRISFGTYSHFSYPEDYEGYEATFELLDLALANPNTLFFTHFWQVGHPPRIFRPGLTAAGCIQQADKIWVEDSDFYYEKDKYFDLTSQIAARYSNTIIVDEFVADSNNSSSIDHWIDGVYSDDESCSNDPKLLDEQGQTLSHLLPGCTSKPV